MKKAATSPTIGRSARAVSAARTRRAARATKSSRAAQAAVATALGAGLLLHGGQAPAAAATAAQPALVAVVGDDPGSGSGGGSDDGGASASGEADSGDSGAGDSGESGGSGDSGGSGESGASGSEEGSRSDGSSGDSGSAPERADAGPATSEESRTADPGATEVTDTPAAVAPASPPAEPRETAPTVERTTAPQVAPVPETAAAEPAPERAATAPTAPDVAALIGQVRAGVASAARAEADRVIAGRAAVAPVVTALVATPSPAARAGEAVAQNPITRLVLALVGVGPAAATGAPTPAVPTTALLVVQWALFRRGENPLFNQAPVAQGQTGAPTTGRVEASDPDGDQLTYTLLEGPSRGDVTVNPDGSYVYVPDADLARTGGTDTFTVIVRDNNPSAPGLGGFTDLARTALARSNPALAERLFGAHTTVATVTIEVPRSDTATPAPPAVVNPSTGVVTGRVGPDDGVPRTYTVSVAPRSGTLTVDQFGRYVYTPTEEARRAAALTPGADVDTATVVVTDPGTGAATARTFAILAASDGTTHTVTLPISEIVTGERIVVGPYPSAPLLSVDGRYAAVRGYDPETGGGSMTVVDTQDGETVTVALAEQVQTYEFSRDGSRLAVTSGRVSSTMLTVIDTATGAVVHQSTLDGGGGAHLSPDGRYVYLAQSATSPSTTPGMPGFPGFPGTPVPGTPGRLSVIDTQDGARQDLASGNFSALQLSADGRRAYTIDQDSGALVVVDTATATVVDTVPAGVGASAISFSPDGTRGYVVDNAGRVTVIRVADDTWRSLGSIPGAGYVNDSDFSADGRYLLVADYQGNRMTVIDVQGDRVVGTVRAGTPSEITYSPDGRLAYVGGNRGDGPGIVTVIDLAAGTGTPIAVGEGYRDTTFSADGTRAYVTTWDGTITVIDTATSAVIGAIAVPERSYALTLSPDGSQAYVTSTNDAGREDDETGDLTVIDLATGDTTVIPVGNRPGPALVSTDGRRVYVNNYYDSSLSVIDTASGTVVRTVSGTGFAPDVALTPDGRFAYAVDLHSDDGGVLLVSTVDDTVSFVPAANISVFDSVRFSPDGRFLYVEAVEDGQLVAVDLDAVGTGAGGDVSIV